MTDDLPPALFIMGPTASGKSALAIQLAQALNGEIISVDSALVYRGMDIGTAKPSLAERATVPHHLIDILDPAESYSTGQFRHQALNLMATISANAKLPILVGGTMLYFHALTGGLAELPNANPELRARLDAELQALGKEALHARLAKVDPDAAARIHPNDPQRIQRALEVYELTGQSLTSYFANNKAALPYRVLKLIVAPEQRKTLHEKIAQRFQLMLQQGFIEEVQALYARGDLNETLPAIRAVGYRQAWSYLNGEYDKTTMTEKSIVATRQLAKRQFTWLRKQVEAVHLATDDEHLLSKTLSLTQQHLATVGIGG